MTFGTSLKYFEKEFFFYPLLHNTTHTTARKKKKITHKQSTATVRLTETPFFIVNKVAGS